VKYINQLKEIDKGTRTLAWIMIVMNTELELNHTFVEIFNSPEILRLYDHQESYFWRNRGELTDCIENLTKKDLYIKTPYLTDFENYVRPMLGEEEKKDSSGRGKPTTRTATNKSKSSKKQQLDDSSSEQKAKSIKSEVVMQLITTKIAKAKTKNNLEEVDVSGLEFGPNQTGPTADPDRQRLFQSTEFNLNSLLDDNGSEEDEMVRGS
jgi:hypothetical protein